MALLPVVCDNPSCRTTWATGSVIGGSGGTISMANTKVGPCPRCGGMGSVPDGTYSLVDDTLHAIRGAAGGLSVDTIQRLLDAAREAVRGDEGRDAFAQRVAAEDPSLAPVVHIFVQQGGGDWTQRLALIVAVLALILQYVQGQRDDPTPPDTAEVVERVLEGLQERPIVPGGLTAQPTPRTPGVTFGGSFTGWP